MNLPSILDTDLYKLTMQQAILELYPSARAEYRFFNRRPSDTFDEAFAETLRRSIQYMPALSLSGQEATWLQQSCPFVKPAYIEYLRNYRYNPQEVEIWQESGQLHIHIKGSWHRTVMWEVPLMALISELYFHNKNWDYNGQRERAQNKLAILESERCHFADFGTRRRRSADAQGLVVEEFCKNTKGFFVGTSNPYFAMKYKTKPIGTQAHEWVQAHSVLGSLRHANLAAMDAWVKVYNAQLGIVLTDTYGLKSFLEDFGPFHARLWDGARHDSGCPFKFTDQLVAHYQGLKIDPATKTLIFSDNLNADKAVEIKHYCDELGIRCSFGIGTHFTNDFDGDLKPLNMVIKMWALNGIPVVKLSEDGGKAVGDKDALRVARWTHYGTPLDA
jgi:nicotinate phosphoribosyltransferase